MIGIFCGRLKTRREYTGNDVVRHIISCAIIFYLQTRALVLSRKHIKVEKVFFGFRLWSEQVEHFHTKMHLIFTKKMVM